MPRTREGNCIMIRSSALLLSFAAGTVHAQTLEGPGDTAPATIAGVIYVNVATGERVVTPFTPRRGPVIWNNSDTTSNGSEFHVIDGRSRGDGRATYNSLSVDWGDIPSEPQVDGIEIGYAVSDTIVSRFPNPNDPNYARVFGLNLIFALWNNENGQHDGSINQDQIALVLPFPDAYGAVPEGTAWTVIFDLEGSREFRILADDQDGDGKVDFGYGYAFRQQQHTDPRNQPGGIPRGTAGPLLVLPGNAGGVGFPASTGVEDALDWYNTFDASFQYNAQSQQYTLNPNASLSRSGFINTYFFGGNPYASYYTRLYGAIVGCTADFNNDGFVDFFDFDDYVNCFETGNCPPGRTADINLDDFVDFFDFDAFVEAFESGCN
jgi:hypothetical protein